MLPTPDKSGEVVHPSVVYFPNGWHGWKYWMAYTPYQFSDALRENPCIAVSNDGITWVEPAGIINPLLQPPPRGYNSDPDLAYDTAHDHLVLRVRQVSPTNNTILVLLSRNGVDWLSPKTTFAELNHQAVSPSWVVPAKGGPLRTWYVNATGAGCGTTVSFVKLRTADVDTATADQTSWQNPIEDLHWTQPGTVIWHLKVREVPELGQFMALYPAYPSGQRGCGSNDLYIAHSDDGVQWNVFPIPVLTHNEFSLATLYRSDFVYDRGTDQLRTWVSAMDTLGHWAVYYTAFDFSALRAVLARAQRLDPTLLKPLDVHQYRHPILLRGP